MVKLYEKEFLIYYISGSKGHKSLRDGKQTNETNNCPAIDMGGFPGHSAGRGGPDRNLQTAEGEKAELRLWESKTSRIHRKQRRSGKSITKRDI